MMISPPTSMIQALLTYTSLCFYLLVIPHDSNVVSAFHPSDFSSSPSLVPPRSAASYAATGNGGGGGNGSGNGESGGGEDEFYSGDVLGGSSLPTLEEQENHETVEEHAAAWRRYQQEKYEHQTPSQAASPTDEEGRMKLLASVSRGSISFFFFILMWRSVHHFELADQAFKGFKRLCVVVPTVSLFILNMAGCVAGFTSPSHGAKKKMKAILNLNKLMELIMFVYNVVRLTILPSKYTPREIYVGRTLSNFIFLVQCQLFTKVTWGAAQIRQEQAATAMPSTTSYSSGDYYSGEQQQQQQYDDAYEQQQQSYGSQQQQQQQWDYTANDNEEEWN